MRRPQTPPFGLLILLAVATAACAGPNGQTDDDNEPDGGGVGETCEGDTPWTCDGGARVHCASGIVEAESCGRGCLPPKGEGDAACIEADDSWSCASSEYMGTQYWTCDPAKGVLHRCDADGGVVVVCDTGCAYGPLGTDDACRAPTGTGMLAMPNIVFNISGGLVAESAVRAPIEEGVRKMLDLMVATLDIDTSITIPTITLNMTPLNQGYCSGLASTTSAQVWCPYGYPVTGTNQNYMVNLSVHEIGHVVARHVLNAQAHVDNCENEGLATWLAKSYWSNFASQPVPSLAEAARREIDAGRASATMSTCILASDAPYKVYGSFFEYLETIPGATQRITNGETTSATYVAGWHTWLGR